MFDMYSNIFSYSFPCFIITSIYQISFPVIIKCVNLLFSDDTFLPYLNVSNFPKMSHFLLSVKSEFSSFLQSFKNLATFPFSFFRGEGDMI